MEAKLFRDVDEYSQIVQEFMMSDPFSTNVIGVHLSRVVSGARAQSADDCFIAAIDQGRVVGIAMWTPPHAVFVSRMQEAAAWRIAEALGDGQRELPGVSGELAAVAAFANEWSARTNRMSLAQTAMRMYRLGELQVPKGISGTHRSAVIDDANLVMRLDRAFHDEATPDQPYEDRVDFIRSRIDAGEIALWVDGDEVVSLAAHSGPSVGVARIGPVYAPLRFRRHGYGSGVTAAATRAALDAGADHVVLYTDLSNPTSNAIYQEIGFIADHDAEERRFTL